MNKNIDITVSSTLPEIADAPSPGSGGPIVVLLGAKISDTGLVVDVVSQTL